MVGWEGTLNAAATLCAKLGEMAIEGEKVRVVVTPEEACWMASTTLTQKVSPKLDHDNAKPLYVEDTTP
jgi:hypothetical protein